MAKLLTCVRKSWSANLLHFLQDHLRQPLAYPLGFKRQSRREEAFKEGRGIQRGKKHSRRKRQSRRNEAFWEGNFQIFFTIWYFYIFLAIPGSWGFHRYPWFQNQYINMARADQDKKEKSDELCFIIYSPQGHLWWPLARISFLECIIESNGVTHRLTDRLLKIKELHTDGRTDYWKSRSCRQTIVVRAL